jgi:hypothetical protein
MEDTLYLHPLHTRIALALGLSLYRNPYRVSTASTCITLPCPMHVRLDHSTIPHLRLSRYFSPLCNFLYGKHHGRFTPPSRSLVRSNGTRRLSNLHLWRFGPPPPPRHKPHNRSRNILDYRALALCHRSARRQLLGLHFSIHDLRNYRHRHHV